MNCYNHRDKPAIGLCRSCGRALCEDCLVEVDRSIACKDACENRVRLINAMLARNPQRARAVRGQMRSSGFLALLMGVGCLIIAVWTYFQLPGLLPYFMGLLAVYCLATGLVRLNRKYDYPALDEESNSDD